MNSQRADAAHLASKSQKEASSLTQGLEGSGADTKGSYSMNCSV